MASILARGGIAASSLPARARGVWSTNVTAASQRIGPHGGSARAAHAKGAHANERPHPPRRQRPHRGDGSCHRGCDSGGERDAAKLSELRHRSIQADEETIRKFLEGDWREEHLFTLKQSRQIYIAYRNHMSCGSALEQDLRQLPTPFCWRLRLLVCSVRLSPGDDFLAHSTS